MFTHQLVLKQLYSFLTELYVIPFFGKDGGCILKHADALNETNNILLLYDQIKYLQ